MMRMNGIAMMKQMLMVFAVALLSIGVAAAADSPAAKGPCADDIAKYCKDVKPGGGGIARCLKENEKQLSPACMSSIEKRVKEAHQACEADVQKFCKDVKPGQGRIVEVPQGTRKGTFSRVQGKNDRTEKGPQRPTPGEAVISDR